MKQIKKGVKNIFQSTPSWRGRPIWCIFFTKDKKFQSTPSWRGRLDISCYIFRCSQISIHALVKRATKAVWLRLRTDFYFNPRPREEGDKPLSFIRSNSLIFQSTPSWRGRLTEFIIPTKQLLYFNPRPREEGDPLETVEGKASCLISIHALVKRATFVEFVVIFQKTISIHALVKRATKKGKVWYGNGIYFNPRPREEGDHRNNPKRRNLWGFQSTPSWRGRHTGNVNKGSQILISIHALVKRATPKIFSSIIPTAISIHALVKRATIADNDKDKTAIISIHALVKRATQVNDSLGSKLLISIHALVKRATGTFSHSCFPCAISIHALVKRATCFHFLFFYPIIISIHALVKRATTILQIM